MEGAIKKPLYKRWWVWVLGVPFVLVVAVITWACCSAWFSTFLGETYYDENNYATGIRYLERSCRMGNEEGCFNAGSMYYEGKGVDVNLSRAEELLTPSCDKGDIDACVMLGDALNHDAFPGADVTARKADGSFDEVKAHKATTLFMRACDKNVAAGCYNLAVEYRWGIPFAQYPLQQNLEYRARLLQKACDLKMFNGCVQLAASYGTGFGVPEDEQKALDILQSACKTLATDEERRKNCAGPN